MMTSRKGFALAAASALFLSGAVACAPTADGARVARSTLVVGIDVSGSFGSRGRYENSIDFAANGATANLPSFAIWLEESDDLAKTNGKYGLYVQLQWNGGGNSNGAADVTIYDQTPLRAVTTNGNVKCPAFFPGAPAGLKLAVGGPSSLSTVNLHKRITSLRYVE